MTSDKKAKSPAFATLGAALWVVGNGVALGYLGEGLAGRNAELARRARLDDYYRNASEPAGDMELYTTLALTIGGAIAILGAVIFLVAALKHARSGRRIWVFLAFVATGIAVGLDIVLVASRASKAASDLASDDSVATVVVAMFPTAALIVGLASATWIVGRARSALTTIVPVAAGLVGATLMGIGARQADARLDEILSENQWDGGPIAFPVITYGLLAVLIAGVSGAWLTNLIDKNPLAGAASVALSQASTPTSVTSVRPTATPPGADPSAFDKTVMAGPPQGRSHHPYSPYAVHQAPPVRRNPVPLIFAVVAVLVVAVAAMVVTIFVTGGSGGVEPAADDSVSLETTAASVPAITTAPPEPESPAPFAATVAGNWRGPVSGDQTGFDVVTQIATGLPVTAKVEYPQIGCAGTWTEQSRQGETVNLIERIGRGTCVVSQITLTPKSDGTLDFQSSYYSQSQGRTFAIYATLQRY